ncbi:MAG TPA: PilZ domain-containing protein [Allosphingosinicella sp.]|nr:PilZ domain-containing protein [Allosphingosinicella sp.]
MRRSERMPVDERARLRPNDWSSLEVRIVDLSESGFRAECEATILCGSAIRIELPGIGETEAQVTWRRRGEIGACFTVPIDLARCAVSKAESPCVLARLLVQRADARGAGRFSQEQELRKRILAALPMHKGDG